MRSPIETLETRRYMADVQPQPATLVARVNFQPAGLRPPKHYTADVGLPFGRRAAAGLKYGWDRNLVANGYQRGDPAAPDARFDSFILSQQGGDAIWEIAVPNGQYTVRVVTGEPTSPNSTSRVAVEGVLTVNGTSNTTTPWVEGTSTVNVTDGRLTLTNATGAANNKLDFVEISTGATSLPVLSVAATDDRGSEAGANPASFRITRTGPTTASVVANYVMTGKAKNGIDYPALSGVATIAAGQTFVDVSLTPTADGIAEGTESVGLYLIYSAGTSSAANLFAVARISDTAVPVDPLPTGTLRWSRGPDAPTARTESLSAVVGGRLYNFGGFYDSTFNQSTRADYYNPTSNTWTRVADMPKAVAAAGVAVVGNDIWIIGGYTQSPGNSAGGSKTFGSTGVYSYHPAINAWQTEKSLPVARASGSAAVVGRALFYIGGENGGRSADTADVYKLDLDNPSAGWAKKASMPDSKNRFGVAVIDGKIYAVGGQKKYDANAVYQNSNFRYDPATNSWTTLAAMKTKVSHITGSTFAYNGTVVTMGGEITGRASTSQVTQYDPASNAWKSLTSLPGARFSPGAGVIGGKFYAAGGSSGTIEKTLYIGTFS